jgi:hypothetical protein
MSEKPAEESAEFTFTLEEKINYFRASQPMSDRPYEETLTRMGGHLKLKFRTMTVQQNNDVYRQIELDKTAGIAKNEDNYLITIMQYRLAQCLVSVNGKLFEEEVDADTEDEGYVSYVKKKAEVFKSWQVHTLSIVLEAFGVFEKRVMKLTEETRSPDFYAAVK